MLLASRAVLGLCLATGTVVVAASPVLAAGSGTTTVRPSAEAWYRVTPTCGVSTGCADISAVPSMYAPDTLHVGVNAGVEEARTYLQLDLAKLPSGTKPAGGTLLLPVAAGSNDGTRAPETAKLQVCAVTADAEIKDAEGASSAPPAADCDAASVPATFVAAAGDAPAAFTADLSALASAWDELARPGALAVVPAEETAPPESWHVAFSDRTRTGTGAVPISAALAFVSASLDTSADAPPAVDVPVFEPAPAPAFDAGTSSSVETGTSFAAPAAGRSSCTSTPPPRASSTPWSRVWSCTSSCRPTP